MKTTDFLNEHNAFIAQEAGEMHMDHEVQMARADCYHAADYAIKLHKLLQQVKETSNLEGWVSEKITIANECLRTVYEYLSYEAMEQEETALPSFTFESAEAQFNKLVNEVNPHNYDSDVDYYAALNAPTRSRSSMPRSRGGDVDSYGNDWDEEEAFRANQRRYAAAKKAQQAADHDRLATGTNESDVEEARVGNRMSDIEIGSPKVVYYKGKAVGEVGLDHEASPGNGPFYMKHYLTGKDMVGYDTKKEALADLKHLVQQMDEGVAEGELTEASIKLVDGQYQVVHNGKVVGTYPGRYAAQDHAHRLNNKPTKTRGKLNANEGVAEGSEADIDKKIAFHQQGQAAAQYKGSMNKMHAKKIRDLEASKKSMGLHASLEQHADDKMKELGHKFRPVGESKKTVSEMTAGGTGAGGFATGPTAGGGKPGTGKPKKIGNMLKRTTPKIGTGIYK